MMAIRKTPEEKLLKSRLQVANEVRDRNDHTVRIYCDKCIRETDPRQIPVVGSRCAFCFTPKDEFTRYRLWFQQRFILIAHSRDLEIHHKSPSQDIIRCLTTMVREKSPPPQEDMIIQAMRESYSSPLRRDAFREWSKKMADAIHLIYHPPKPRKRTIKASQGRQTGQLKLGFFEVD